MSLRVGITALPRDVQGMFRPYPGQTIDVFSAQAIERAGAVPLVLPVAAPRLAAAQVAVVDAIVLSGGSDVDAALFGAERHPATELVDEARDRWELAVIAAARDRGLPLLGICRGAQLLNVERDGTLVGHLETAQEHQLDMMIPSGRHDVTAVPGTTVAALLGVEPVAVASNHHQAIDALGRGLRVAARSADGVVEAIEADDAAELAVQWHPEFQLDEPAGQPLFDWLVAAAHDGGRTG